jgi:hypothetical protein
MTDCARPDISERLLMALAPDEFPEEAHEVEEHLKQCPQCRNELDALRTVHKILGDHRQELSNVFEACPTAESLVEFALGEQTSETIQDHISFCPNCAEQVSLIGALLNESENEATRVTPDAGPLIRKVVSKELGWKDESGSPPPEQTWHKFIQFFHVPSLALGAAAAVICFLIVASYQSKELGFRPALSNVTWTTSTSVTPKDTSGPPSTQATQLKKVAILILLPQDMRLSDKDIDKMYSEIDLAARLGSQYRFLSPHEMKRVLEDRSGLDAQSISEVAKEKSGADYVLVFEITQSKSGYDLNGRLFRKGQKEEFTGAFQTGLPLSAIPSKINSIGKELLLDAES